MIFTTSASKTFIFTTQFSGFPPKALTKNPCLLNIGIQLTTPNGLTKCSFNLSCYIKLAINYPNPISKTAFFEIKILSFKIKNP